VTSLIGPNGAGKTTLLMLIARLLEPGDGDITVDGRSIAHQVRITRGGHLRQAPDFHLRLTVEELVAFGTSLQPGYPDGARPARPSTTPSPFCRWSRCASLTSMN
jgi:ABC-type enterochelin transport system ATPase subunit